MPVSIDFPDINQPTIKSLADLIPEATDRALQDYVRTLKTLVKGRTPIGEQKRVGKGRKRKYTPGRLRQSWQVAREGNDTISFSTDVPYAHVLEYGKYKGVGPRTQAGSGGIYSRQAVGGILRPLLQDNQLLDQMTDRIVKEIVKSVK